MSKTPVYIVTGANKGIGRATVEVILQSASPALVYLTSRNPDLGQQAIKELSESVKPPQSLLAYHQLDVSDPSSIERFAQYIKAQHPEKVDVLINNAGIAAKGSAFDSSIVKDTLQTNYYGLVSMREKFAPMIKDGGRIVNVSSLACKSGKIKSNSLRAKFHDPKATPKEITALMEKFQNDVDAGTWEKEWPTLAYSVSKMGVTGFTETFARQHPNLLINCTCPGYVDTDMTSHAGVLPTEEGGSRVAHLALADLKGTTGAFWEAKKVSSW